MSYENNNIAKLLDMEDVIVKKVENFETELHIYIELPRKEHICPRCGCVTDEVHDYRTQKVKHISLGKTTYLNLRKTLCREESVYRSLLPSD